jgi:hypothetical protein
VLVCVVDEEESGGGWEVGGFCDCVGRERFGKSKRPVAHACDDNDASGEARAGAQALARSGTTFKDWNK